jgi:hypothetical protein
MRQGHFLRAALVGLPIHIDSDRPHEMATAGPFPLERAGFPTSRVVSQCC